MAPRKGTSARRRTVKSKSFSSRIKEAGSNFLSRVRKIFSLKRIIAVFLVLGFLVAGLGVVYRFEAVHPVSTLMIGRVITGKPVDRQWVDLDAISNIMKYSVIMSEDGQFCAHRGVDWAEFRLVVDGALSGERIRGASTLTMQTVKNLFLWNSRSYFRKVLEIPIAIYIDALWSKKRILEVYLNIAEFGDGIFGVEAAAQTYFKTSAAKLGPRGSALLTSALPNPLARNPAKPGRQHLRIAKIVQRRASKSGGYTRCVR